MIDTDNLRTASLYINNQLLSRGLLRDGQTIDFASAGKDNEDGATVTGRIISVVNDLILRRDRDAEHRESLSATMRALRAENLKHINDTTRLSEKNTEAQRKLDIAEASEASAKTQLKSAEAAVRGLKDEMTRTKALVAQSRASCATEVRRRDRQIDTLKKQLGEAGRSRGSRANPAITTIHVTGDVGAEKMSPTRAGSTATEDYSLRSETNAFLAKLSQNLSVENEALVGVMQRMMGQLREMSGYPGDEKQDPLVVKTPGWEELTSELDSVMEHMRNILTNPSFVPLEEVVVREEEINRLKDGWVKMETRWEEAVHLIDSWRKRMAASGKPVCDEELKMGLRLSPVRVHDVEETRAAYGIGLSAVKEEECEERYGGLRSSPCPPAQQHLHLEAIEGDDESVSYRDDAPVDDYEAEEPNFEVLQESTAAPRYHSDTSGDSSPLPSPPQLSPLRNSSSAGNRGSARNGNGKVLPKPGDFTTIVEENTRDLAAAGSSSSAAPQPPPHRTKLAVRPLRPIISQSEKPRERQRSPTRTSLDDALLPEMEPEYSDEEHNYPEEEPLEAQDSEPRAGFMATPRRGPSRLPLARHADPAPQQSPLTMSNIAAKLAASEREADAARVRAKLRAVRGAGGVKRPNISHPETEPEEAKSSSQGRRMAGPERGSRDADPVKHESPPQDEQQIKPEKRKRNRKPGKATSRRRSTLSPWELETLISGNAQ